MPIVILEFVEGLLGPKLAKYAKPLIYLLGALLLVGGFFGLRACHDSHVIKNYTNAQEAKTAKADKKADNHAADQRVIDTSREQDEKTQTQGAIDNAKRNGTDPRAAYYDCVRKQQSARRAGQPSPRC